MMQTLESDFFNQGPWSKITLDVVVPFYNEETNIHKTHQSNKRLEKLFHIGNYIYVDNGSKDKTQKILQELASSDEKIKIVVVKKNIGYGNGMRTGLFAASADYILTNHADMQFDSYTFFSQHLPALNTLLGPRSIFPYRTNRSLSDKMSSFCLRLVLSCFQFKRVYDFNGQPKLFPRKFSKELVGIFPNDFSFDLALYLYFYSKQSLRLPVIQRDRHSGLSSWNINYFARFKQVRNWLWAGFRLSFQDRYSALRECQKKNNQLL